MRDKTIEKSIVERTISGAITSNAESVRTNAFKDCINLTSISFPNAKTIGANAFNNCTNLSSVSLPSVEAIGFDAFGGTLVTEIHAEHATTFSTSRVGAKVYLGKNLTSITSTGMNGLSFVNTHDCIVSFEHSANDPVLFSMADWPIRGSSKNNYTYDIYTDNQTIKDGCLARADQYTTVNVYHIDGSAW